YSDEAVIIQKKVVEPGASGSATYKRLLAENNGQLKFAFVDSKLFTVDERKPILFELTHGPLEDDRSKIGFLHLVIPHEGVVLAHFPLTEIYPAQEDDENGGIEHVPDLPPILPKPGAQTNL